jgi:Tannase and feruloyl esterase
MAEQRVSTARRAQLGGSTACCRLSLAIYVVQIAQRVDPGPITAGNPVEQEETMQLYTLQAGQPITRQRRKNRVAPLLTVAATIFYAAPAAADSCSNLLSLSLLPNTTITLSQTYTAGQTVSGTTIAPAGLCRVAGTIKPGPKSNVHFEVWIPTDGSWNGKYQQIGNGGFAGSISLSGIANAVSRGYATAGTDDGTSGPPSGAPAFIGNRDVLLDYGYRAIKATSDDSKSIIDILTGQAPSHSYFVGCSDGGREALQEAQRFPDDFAPTSIEQRRHVPDDRPNLRRGKALLHPPPYRRGRRLFIERALYTGRAQPRYRAHVSVFRPQRHPDCRTPATCRHPTAAAGTRRHNSSLRRGISKGVRATQFFPDRRRALR